MAIKFTFFDLYGTLVTFNRREPIQKAAAAKHNLTLTDEGIGKGYTVADVMMAEQNATQPIREMTEEQRNNFFARYEQAILRGDGHEVDLDTARAIWLLIKDERPGFGFFPDARQGLRNIKRLGIGIGLISNMNKTGEELRAELGLGQEVDFVITSLETGVEKPHPDIFKAALAKAQCQPSQAAHVGDQLSADIQGAESAGIQPILIDRYNNYPDYKDHPRAQDMRQVAQWLEQHA